VMDPVRLRNLVRYFDDDADSSLDFEEVLANFRLLTCPDPLTLERAKEVMGREPDASTDCGKCIGFEREDVSLWEADKNDVRCFILERVFNNPTVGQFACLALAAKQGVGG